jgi:hypothetical protein
MAAAADQSACGDGMRWHCSTGLEMIVSEFRCG